MSVYEATSSADKSHEEADVAGSGGCLHPHLLLLGFQKLHELRVLVRGQVLSDRWAGGVVGCLSG